MSISTGNIEPSYKKEPAYRVTSIVVPALFVVIVLLFIWFSRGEIKIKEPRTITLYCFSAMELVMEQSLLPAFQKYWFEENREQVEFITTFTGSGVITRQIMTRFPAEVAVLSSELDARRLTDAGIITTTAWQELRRQPKFCRSPIVLFVADRVKTTIDRFEDINFETLNVIIPDPLTSGEGQMAALALYGSKLRQGFSNNDALEYVGNILAKTQNHPSTSQAAMEQFHAGIGDILFNYEAATAYHKIAAELNIVYPDKTIMTEPVAVSIQNNITSKQSDIIAAFMKFLWSDVAQESLSEFGFQTINTSKQAGFVPTPTRDIFTLDSLGSATDLNRTVIDPLVAR